MLKQLYPSYYVDSAYGIDYQSLYEEGIRGLIFDIDNTLVPHGADADERSCKLIGELKNMGFSICLLSNNGEERVKRFNKDVNVPYIYKAGKPATGNYEKAMERMKTDRKSTVFIGDQLFTDVYGANRAGLTSFLVKPMDPHEEIQIVLKRILEKPVLWFYKRRTEQ